MENKYLIMKCEPLFDAYECDCNRIPITMVSDWEKWYKENMENIDYQFEVYEYKNNAFESIKGYEEAMEEGMALYWWYEGEDFDSKPTIIQKFINKTRFDEIPTIVQEYINQSYEKHDNLRTMGYYNFFTEDKSYFYGEYSDNNYAY